jgi:hypothetical protein
MQRWTFCLVAKQITADTRSPWLVGLLVAALLATFTTPAGAVPPPADFFAVSSGAQLGNEAEAEEIERLGTHTARINITWQDLQPGNCDESPQVEAINWTLLDERIRSAARHNVTALAVFYGNRAPPTPCENGNELHRFPLPGTRLFNEYSQPNGFAWQAVRRYGVNGTFWGQPAPDGGPVPYRPIRTWEIWNEENQATNNWGGQNIYPQAYAKFLIETAKTVRAAQEAQSGMPVSATGTKVLMGGLDTFAGDMPSGEFFDRIYTTPNQQGYSAAQLHSAFDGLSYHPYALANGSGGPGTPAEAQTHISNARTVLNNHGDSGKSLWITELGWPVGSFYNPKNGVTTTISEQQQADNIAQSFSWIYSHADEKNIALAAVFFYRDTQPGCGDWSCWSWVSGLKRLEGSVRSSWCSFANLVGVNPCSESPPVAAVIKPNGTASVKIDNLYGWWVDEPLPNGAGAAAIKTASDPKNGLLLAVLGTDQHVYVKQGLDGSWVDEIGPAKAVSVATDATNGPLIAVLTNDEHALVKKGDLHGAWVDESGGIKEVSVATDPVNGPLIGVKTWNEHILVKKGNLYGVWVDEIGPAKAVSVATDATNGPLIAVLTNDEHALVKTGNLYGAWVDESGGIKEVSVATDAAHGPLIGVKTWNGHALVKQGNLYGVWADEIGGGLQSLSVASDEVNGALIGLLTNESHFLLKLGNLYGAWIDEFGGVPAFSLAD